jgi:hypothetical protein
MRSNAKCAGLLACGILVVGCNNQPLATPEAGVDGAETGAFERPEPFVGDVSSGCRGPGLYEAGKNGDYRPCCPGLRETFYQLGAVGEDGVKLCVSPPLRVYACVEGRCGDGVCEIGESQPCGCVADCPSAVWGDVPTGELQPGSGGATEANDAALASDSVASSGAGSGGIAATGGTTGAGGTNGSVDAPSDDRPMSDGRDLGGPETVTPGTCGGSFIACGCGCCGGATTDLPMRCYYPGAGESIETVTAADLATKNATDCNHAGCSLGVKYSCCPDYDPNPADPVRYGATYGSSLGGVITLSSYGPMIYRAVMFTRSPSRALPGFRMDLPDTWAVAYGANYGKTYGETLANNAIGGRGSIAIRASGAHCVLDAHVTLYTQRTHSGAFPYEGAVRFDVDDMVIDYAPASLCGVSSSVGDDGGVCATADAGLPDLPTFGCVEGNANSDPNRVCSAAGPDPVCAGGNWGCPSGSFPDTQCGCFFQQGVQTSCYTSICQNHQWACPSVDAG